MRSGNPLGRRPRGGESLALSALAPRLVEALDEGRHQSVPHEFGASFPDEPARPARAGASERLKRFLRRLPPSGEGWFPALGGFLHGAANPRRPLAPLSAVALAVLCIGISRGAESAGRGRNRSTQRRGYECRLDPAVHIARAPAPGLVLVFPLLGQGIAASGVILFLCVRSRWSDSLGGLPAAGAPKRVLSHYADSPLSCSRLGSRRASLYVTSAAPTATPRECRRDIVARCSS
jgi:hypothetical protein